MTETHSSLSRANSLHTNEKGPGVTDVTENLHVTSLRARTHARARGRARQCPDKGVTVTSVTSVTERLETLADDLRRLRPDGRDPERFHQAKSDIEAGLRELALEVRHGR